MLDLAAEASEDRMLDLAAEASGDRIYGSSGVEWLILVMACFGIGFWARLSWKHSLIVALVAFAAETLAAFVMDAEAGGVVSSRMGGLLGLPSFLVPLISGIISAYLSLFFSRMGSALRHLL